MHAENRSMAVRVGGKNPAANIIVEKTRCCASRFTIQGKRGHNTALISDEPKRAIIPGAFFSRSPRIAAVAAPSCIRGNSSGIKPALV